MHPHVTFLSGHGRPALTFCFLIITAVKRRLWPKAHCSSIHEKCVRQGGPRLTKACGYAFELLIPHRHSGVYNRDPDRCLDALTTMGVYVNTGDRTAVRRTAEFFLKGFQVCRLDGSTRGHCLIFVRGNLLTTSTTSHT